MASVAPNPTTHHFERSKPFYPLVVSYVSQLIGLKELMIRPFVGTRTIDEVVARQVAAGQPAATSQPDVATLRQDVEKAMGPLQLRSEFLNSTIMVDIDEIAAEVVREHNYLLEHQLNAAGGVLILAHEVSTGKAWHDKSPLWEFLRHCRNAAAHGGKFNLLNGEPRRPAQWGSFQITRALQGTPLFKCPNGPGLLSLGDPIRLLWDIEQAFPAMHA